ncbi:hypothetical protein [Microbacterium sp. gxy059]|uniref:hypothetical protein n=1 Tax=Microbacterium sp. gxy059 TaxID=2957199 RepID=UPI003D97D13E
MSHHAQMLHGLAQHIADAELGIYRPDGVYQPDERGIVISAFPETPEEVISVALYQPAYTPFSPTASRRLTVSHIQIRWRTLGDPLNGIDMFDALSHLIDEQLLNLGPIIARGRYRSFSPIGQDKNHRTAFTSNWTLTALEAL